MKPSSYTVLKHDQITPTTTSDDKTSTVPAGCSAVMISVETTDARLSFDGTAPSSSVGNVFPKGLAPVLLPIVPVSVQAVSTASANAVVDIVYLA